MASEAARLLDIERWRDRLDDARPGGLPKRIDDVETVLVEMRAVQKTIRAFAFVVSTTVGLLTFVLLLRGLL